MLSQSRGHKSKRRFDDVKPSNENIIDADEDDPSSTSSTSSTSSPSDAGGAGTDDDSLLDSILGTGGDSSKTNDASKASTGTTPAPATDNTKGTTPTKSPTDTSSGTAADPNSKTGTQTGTGSNTGSSSTGSKSNPPSPNPNPAPAPPSPTPTTSTSTTAGPTPTSTSTSSFTSSTTTALPTSTSSTTSAPLTSIPTSTSSLPLTSTVFTTQEPSATAAPPAGTPGTISGAKHSSGGANIGAIIGGCAGGLVALIVIVYLILIPVRQRAKRQKELDWLDFDGRENDHADADGMDQSIFRTPRAGVGDDDDKMEYHNAGSTIGAMSNIESYPMNETSTAGPHGYYPGYGAHDNGGRQWAGYGANVVGEAPYGMNYPTGYYAQHGSPPLGAGGGTGEMYAQSGPYPAMPQQSQDSPSQQPWPGMPAQAHSGSQGALAAMGSVHRAVSPQQMSRTNSSPTLQRSHSGGAPLQRDPSMMSMMQPLPPPKDAQMYDQGYNDGHSPGGGNGHGGGNGYAPQYEQVNATAINKPQRRLSGRSGRSQGAGTDRDEDFVLPYDREDAASSQPHFGVPESPRPPPKMPLHLANPDD